MLSTPIAHFLARRNVHYGWAVVLATFVTMLVVAGAMGAPGVLITPLGREMGWTTSQISSALSLRFLLFGAMAPFSAVLMNYFGVRRIMVTSLSVVLAGLLGSLVMTKLWQLVALWGVVVGVGSGLTAMVLGATVATRWFSARRGLVVGVLSASVATGQLVFQPLLATIATHDGWRHALLFVCGALFVAICVVLLLMRDRPSDVGLPPYGEKNVLAPVRQDGDLFALLWSPLRTLKQVAGVRVFWILAGTFLVCGASTNGLIQTHFVSMCGDFGLQPVRAAGVLALMGFFDLFGTVGSGWLSDRYDNRWLLFSYYGLRGLSLIYLPFIDFSFYELSIFALFFGLDWIATLPPTVKLSAKHFGVERANVVFGWIFASHQLGAAFAAYGAGLARTLILSYLPAFFAAGVLCLVAALTILLLKETARTGNALLRAGPVAIK